jgi:hypothetical protein
MHEGLLHPLTPWTKQLGPKPTFLLLLIIIIISNIFRSWKESNRPALGENVLAVEQKRYRSLSLLDKAIRTQWGRARRSGRRRVIGRQRRSRRRRARRTGRGRRGGGSSRGQLRELFRQAKRANARRLPVFWVLLALQIWL